MQDYIERTDLSVPETRKVGLVCNDDCMAEMSADETQGFVRMADDKELLDQILVGKVTSGLVVLDAAKNGNEYLHGIIDVLKEPRTLVVNFGECSSAENEDTNRLTINIHVGEESSIHKNANGYDIQVQGENGINVDTELVILLFRLILPLG